MNRTRLDETAARKGLFARIYAVVRQIPPGRVATYGQEPDTLVRFRGNRGDEGAGAMWRVADVTVRVDESGETVDCDVVQLHRPGVDSGYFITYDDPRFFE